MPAAKPETDTVNIECLCNPDVHIGDGRVLQGPQREGTVVVVPGQVTSVSREIADQLIARGQVRETDRPATVFIEDSAEFKVRLAEEAIRRRKAEELAKYGRV